MPTMLIKPRNGKVDVGDIELDLALLTALAPIEGADGVTAKLVKLQDTRVSFKAVPNGQDHPAEFTVSLQVSRTPVNDTELVRTGIKADLQKQRKIEKDLAAEVTIDRSVARAVSAERNASDRIVEIARDTTKMVAQALAAK